jgi:hypothetical protein
VRERPTTSAPPATPWLAARLQLALDAVAHHDAVRGSGCLLVDRTSALRAVANAGPGAEALSLAEELCHEGPCHDALDGFGVEVPDVRAERRWPRLDVLIEATPLRSVVSLPVTYHGDPVGALYAFTARDAELTRASYDALRAAVTEVEALVAEALAGSRRHRRRAHQRAACGAPPPVAAPRGRRAPARRQGQPGPAPADQRGHGAHPDRGRDPVPRGGPGARPRRADDPRHRTAHPP